MPRQSDGFWWDEKTSIGKTPRQIVKIIGKEFLFNQAEERTILTKLSSLKEERGFFNKSFSITIAVLVCTYLCSNALMLGKEPVSPWKFVAICRRHRFGISYNVLMKHVRRAKIARLFPAGPDCLKLIKKYRNRMAFKFGFDKKVLDEIQELAQKEIEARNVTGKNPFVAAAGLTYFVVKKNNLQVYQEQLSSFFGVTETSIRKMWKVFHDNSINGYNH